MFPKLTRCFKLYHVLLWTYPKKGLLSSMSTFSLSAIIFLGISLFGVTMAERSCKIMTLSHHAWNSAHVNVVHHESRSFCATFWSKIHGSKIPQKKLTFPLKRRRLVISVPDFGAKNSPPSDCLPVDSKDRVTEVSSPCRDQIRRRCLVVFLREFYGISIVNYGKTQPFVVKTMS